MIKGPVRGWDGRRESQRWVRHALRRGDGSLPGWVWLVLPFKLPSGAWPCLYPAVVEA